MEYRTALTWVAHLMSKVDGDIQPDNIPDEEDRITWYRQDIRLYIEWLEIQLATHVKQSFNRIQEEQKIWEALNFPDATVDHNFKGMVEELGELSHHMLKAEQGIRGEEDYHDAGRKDSIGDLIIFTMALCNKFNYNLTEIVNETWEQVRKRDWNKDAKKGQTNESTSQEIKHHERNRHSNG